VPKHLDGVDLVVIGGGQLLSGANLNFPLKIAHLVDRIERAGLPFVLHSIGVAATWNRPAARQFARVLRSPCLAGVSVRDPASGQALRAHISRMGLTLPVPVTLCPDPAICADLLGLPEEGPRAVKVGRRIGLGLTHPAALATHGRASTLPNTEAILNDYRALVLALSQQGAQVHVFTNGAGEDEEFLDLFWSRMPDKSGCFRTPRRANPRELAAFLNSMDAVASHRLHACITANALGVKAVGFKWDPKMDAYFDLTSQRDALFAGPQDHQLLCTALLGGADHDTRPALDPLRMRVRSGFADVINLAAGLTQERQHASRQDRPTVQSDPAASKPPEPAGRKSNIAHSETHA